MTDKQDIHAEMMELADDYATIQFVEGLDGCEALVDKAHAALDAHVHTLTDRLTQAEQEIVALTLSVSNRDARIAELEAQPAPAVVEPDDLQDAISKALRRA